MEAKICDRHNSVTINSAQVEEYIKLTNASTFSSAHMDEGDKRNI
jgi:hypothetical protein